MDVIRRTKETIYLRLPREQWREMESKCECSICKKNGGKGYWDTLAISVKAPKKGNDYACEVHFPTGS